MSNLDRAPGLTELSPATVAARPVHVVYPGKVVQLGGSTEVRRLLPNLGRRLVGAWCFVDHYGPDDVADDAGMQVPPHPHIGLQTVSWLRAGTVRHRDSLGSDQLIAPGELGLMTAGGGIAHAEHSPAEHPRMLHGVQLWVALPSGARDGAAGWEHHADLPRLNDAGLDATLILGSLGGATSPGTTHSDLVGVELRLAGDALVPLEADFEHAVLVLSGEASVDGVPLGVGSMLYLGTGRRDLRLHSDVPAVLMLLGGAPFEEDVLMWWNFVGRSHDEIAHAREQWQAGERFGTVSGAGTPLPAPPLPPGRLKPGGATR